MTSSIPSKTEEEFGRFTQGATLTDPERDILREVYGLTPAKATPTDRSARAFLIRRASSKIINNSETVPHKAQQTGAKV